VIEEIKRLQFADAKFPISVPADLYGELRAILNRYIQTVVGIAPRMQPFLPSVTRTESNA
jgi:hypothetical protein